MNTRVDDVVLEEPESNALKTDEEDIKFDLSLAVILAGYSFEAYNEQVWHLTHSHHCKFREDWLFTIYINSFRSIAQSAYELSWKCTFPHDVR